MDTKKIPAIVMLLAGVVACIATYINHYSLEDMLVVLLITLVVFLIIGVAIKLILDSFNITQDDDKVDDEGEVVEKIAETSEDEETQQNDVVNDENAEE